MPHASIHHIPQIRHYLRGIPMQNYIIFYRVIDQDIEIMRVIRGDRNLEAIFEEKP